MNLEDYLLIYIGYYYQRRTPFSLALLSDLLAQLKVPHHLSTLRKIYSAEKKAGLIREERFYRRTYPNLSQNGRLRLKTHLIFRRFGEWDQKWRLVAFEIPESERHFRVELREKLLTFGFRPLMDSVFLSPHPLLGAVKSFCRDLGINQYVKTLTTSKLDDEKKIVQELWDLPGLERKYRHFLRAAKTKENRFWPFRAKYLEREFAEIYNADPQLPEEFLPDRWPAPDAFRAFKKIANSYEQPVKRLKNR